MSKKLSASQFFRRGNYTLPSGNNTTYFYDFKKAFLNDNWMKHLLDQLVAFAPCNMIGIGYFGNMVLSYLCAVQELKYETFDPKSNLKKINPIFMFLKTYGLGNISYGLINLTIQTIFLEEVLSSGATFKRVLPIIKEKIMESVSGDIFTREKIYFEMPKKIVCMINRKSLKSIEHIEIIELCEKVGSDDL